MEYISKSLASLESSIGKFKNWNGINANNWGKYFYKENINPSLDIKLTRFELLDSEFIKELSNEELTIAILSWGGMNREHGKSLFEHKEWITVIANMRKGSIKSRKEAYEFFLNLRKKGKLTGMGPAYFTKLICFVNPNLKGYIMDQWTSKSINILFENKVINLSKSGHVTDKNTADIYEDFCVKIEYLAELLKLSPIDLEENLFSNGGINKGNWRRYVVDNWSNCNKSKPTKKTEIINCIEMEPITFEEALIKLRGDKIEIPTLGDRSRLRIIVENNLILITNSKNRKFSVNQILWSRVMDRMIDLPQEERGMTSRYGVGNKIYNWENCPNRDAASIAAIVKYFCK